MTDDELIGVFIYSMSLLCIDETGLTDDNQLDDLETVARLCRDVKAITAEQRTPEEMALRRLALCTEDVLVTWVILSRRAVKQWMIARAELLELQLAANN